jgi:hypothetical protein
MRAGSSWSRREFSHSASSDKGVPTLGPHQKGAEGALERYGGLTKLWNKMKGEKVDDLVGDNKKGGKNDEIQSGD